MFSLSVQCDPSIGGQAQQHGRNLLLPLPISRDPTERKDQQARAAAGEVKPSTLEPLHSSGPLACWK